MVPFSVLVGNFVNGKFHRKFLCKDYEPVWDPFEMENYSANAPFRTFELKLSCVLSFVSGIVFYCVCNAVCELEMGASTRHWSSLQVASNHAFSISHVLQTVCSVQIVLYFRVCVQLYSYAGLRSSVAYVTLVVQCSTGRTGPMQVHPTQQIDFAQPVFRIPG